MKNNALRTSGALFLLISVAQGVRFAMRVPVVAGSVEIPVWISAVAAVVMLGLAIWMFKAAGK